MKKLIFPCLCFALILFTTLLFPTSTVYAENVQTQSLKVISNYASVYTCADESSDVIFVATHKDVYEIISTVQVESTTFHQIKISEQQSGYILDRCVVVNPQKNIATLINPNATFKKNVTASTLYKKIGDEYVEFCQIETSDQTQIRIIDGYKKSKEFTTIQILIDDELQTLCVKTSDIKPYGMPTWLKVIISIVSFILTGAIITLVTFYIKKIFKRKQTTQN